ncbi:MAG TPA: apolipoprotein N-acyltransferase [Castellaniella sp.]|uniref:apolipoprotein N-acyltransferase n=1 Tax=Castellaniella sp. TaxID=1955812 RepID=UPI002F17B8E8
MPPERQKIGKSWIRVLLAGALQALCFAPGPLPAWVLPFAQIGALSVLAAHTWSAPSPWRAALQGWIFGVAQFAIGVYWLVISMHTYGGLALPLAIVALLVFAATMALYGAAACALSAWLCSAWRTTRQHASRQILNALIWASSWTLFEWLRGTLFTGFTWLNIGYAHAEGVFSAWAPVVGVYGLAWLAAFSAAAVASMARAKDSPPYNRSAAAVVVLALGFGLLGVLGTQIDWVRPKGSPLLVRLVQPATPQSEKFDPQLFGQILARGLNLAALPSEGESSHPSLIVLPETVMPIFQDQVSAAVWREWQNVAQREQATIVMGVPLHTRTITGERYTNSAIALRPDDLKLPGSPGEWHYDKRHLVPFGEFIPPGLQWFVHALRIPLGDFNRGPLIQAPLLLAGQVISVNICYEDTFGEEIAARVAPAVNGAPGASILLNLSNLAWFGNTWALRQHLQMARMRALETARPVIRATNTGITAAIGLHGEIQAALEPGSRGVLDVEVQGTQGLTPYVRWRNTPVLTWIALCLAAGLLRRKRTRLSSSR